MLKLQQTYNYKKIITKKHMCKMNNKLKLHILNGIHIYVIVTYKKNNKTNAITTNANK